MGGSQSNPVHVPGVSLGKFIERGKKGEIVDVYREESVLGVGGFGKVFKVVRDRDKQVFALKVIPVGTPHHLKMVQDEIKSLSSLKHTNLVGFVHWFKAETVVHENIKDPKIKTSEAFCVVMEFVEGEDLSKLLQRQNKLPVTMVMSWFLKVLEATAYFHSKGCVHRDLKPANIVINVKTQMVKIVDFGIAGWIKSGPNEALDGANERTLAGSDGFMPPTLIEAWKGGAQKAAIDPSGDMWALGIILYQCFTLKHTGLSLETFESKEDAFQSAAQAIKHLEDDDSGAIKWLLGQMLCPQKDRARADSLLASKEIAAWRIALNPEEKMVTPTLKTEMMPYIATLGQLSVPAPIRTCNFDRLRNLIEASASMGMCAWELNLLNACVLHFDDESLAAGISQDRLMLMLLGALLESGASPQDTRLKDFASKFKMVGVRATAIKCMYHLLNRPPTSFLITENLYAAPGAVEKLWHLATQGDGDLTAECIALLLRHKIPTSFSCDYFLQAVLTKNANNFEALYSVAPLHDNPALFQAFLEKLLARSERLTSPVLRLFAQCRNPMSTWVDFETVRQQFGALVYFALHSNDLNKHFKDLMIDFLRHALPAFTPLTKACANVSMCTHMLTDGIIPTEEPLVTCTDCSVAICLSCVRMCHRGHKLSTFFPVQRSNEPCGCSVNCRCRATPSSLAIFEYKQPAILSEPYTLHEPESLDGRMTAAYWREKQILKITYIKDEHKGGECVTEMFRSKGVHFNYSGVSSTVFYYEVTILQAIPRQKLHVLAVGLAPEKSKRVDHLIGLDDHEFGYHSNDGNMHCASLTPSGVIGPCYGEGDTIGCGIRGDGVVYFTYNGYYLADSNTKISRSAQYFAAVSSIGYECKFQFHFSGPFVFCPQGPVIEEQIREKFSQVSLPMVQAMFCSMPAGLNPQEPEVAAAPKPIKKLEYPLEVRVAGAGSDEVNGVYKRTTEVMLNVPIFRMEKDNKHYHVCRSGSTKTKTVKWWICRADRNGIDNDIDFYTAETDSEFPPQNGWTVLKGTGGTPTISHLLMREVKSGNKCPNGHTLASGIATHQLCDICKNDIPLGQPMSSCRPCDFDMCKACKAVTELQKDRSQSQDTTVPVTWPRLFECVLQAPHAAAGLILWSFFLYEPEVFFAFCRQHPVEYELIAKSSKRVVFLLQNANEVRAAFEPQAQITPAVTQAAAAPAVLHSSPSGWSREAWQNLPLPSASALAASATEEKSTTRSVSPPTPGNQTAQVAGRVPVSESPSPSSQPQRSSQRSSFSMEQQPYAFRSPGTSPFASPSLQPQKAPQDFPSPNSSFSIEPSLSANRISASSSSAAQTFTSQTPEPRTDSALKQEDMLQQISKLVEINRMLMESRTISAQTLRAQLGASVCVRPADSETAWGEIVIQPNDTLEVVKNKVCSCLGRDVSSLVKIEKVINQNISVAVTIDHQVSILQSGNQLIAHFRAA